jgi:hypothetical protein
MSIINATYYKGDINLTSTQLNGLIDGSGSDWQSIYEDVIMEKLLGYPLSKLYKADLNGSSDPTAERFKSLVDGAEFSFEYAGNTIETKWMGLRNKTLLTSLIAYYVYYQYRNETETFNSGSGQRKAKTENSVDVDVRPKLINSWNKMIYLYGHIPSCYANKDNFLNNDNYVHYNSLPSAYNYLLANIDTYPEWIFEPLETQNIFGI